MPQTGISIWTLVSAAGRPSSARRAAGSAAACALALAESGVRSRRQRPRRANRSTRRARDIADPFRRRGDGRRRRCQHAGGSGRSCWRPVRSLTFSSTTMAARRAASFRDLDREKLLDGVIQNMVTPIELIPAVIDGMADARLRPDRQRHLVFGADADPRPRPLLRRARRADRLSRRRLPAIADRNVTINNLLPGRMDTERLQSGFPAPMPSGTAVRWRNSRRTAAASIPARRFGTAEEFGQACAFLCSAQAGYITGQNILIDGGLFPGAF